MALPQDPCLSPLLDDRFLGAGTLSYQYLSVTYCFTQCLALGEMGTGKISLMKWGDSLGERKEGKIVEANQKIGQENFR